MPERMVVIPRPEPQGQLRPKRMVEIKHIVTSKGIVIQEFVPAKKKKHKTRRG